MADAVGMFFCLTIFVAGIVVAIRLGAELFDWLINRG